ncbi:MAG TPA: hypothetical protein PKO44_07955 [Candidatus Omnitrophota bacterium]|nr:hypothetical protein [Candidatus Omnitrophota bacterium]
MIWIRARGDQAKDLERASQRFNVGGTKKHDQSTRCVLNKKASLKEYAQKYRYFSIGDIARDLGFEKKTLKVYLSAFKKEKIVYDAGRGWYSNIAEPFELSTESLQEIVAVLRKKYPLLKFSCWSMQQINRFTHHMLGKYVTFIYMDWDSMSVVYDFLKDAGYDVWLNPRGKEAERFSVREQTIVLRPAISGQPAKGFFAPIEKIMVDLYLEIETLNVMSEYEIVRSNILADGRIDVASLLSYARRRRVPKAEVWGNK